MQSINQVMGKNRIFQKNVLGERTCDQCGQVVEIYVMNVPDGKGGFKQMKFDECWHCKKAAEEKELVKDIVFNERTGKFEDRVAKQKKLQKLFDDLSFINPNLKGCTFENYETTTTMQQEAFEMARKYVEVFSLEEPKNLIFWGSYGTGKSHLSVAILKELMKQGYSGIFVSVPKLLQAFRNTYNKDAEYTEGELLEALETVDCLVLDDLGAENSTDWAVDKLFNIVDSRQGKNTVFTTNLDMKALEQKIGPRNFSRVMMNANVLKMVGRDYRKG